MIKLKSEYKSEYKNKIYNNKNIKLRFLVHNYNL